MGPRPPAPRDLLAALEAPAGMVPLGRGSDSCADGGGSSTALHAAAAKGQQGVIKTLLQDRAVQVDARDATGATPLIESCKKGWQSTVSQLLRAGADPAAVDNEGMSALCWAAAKGKATVAKCLLAAGAPLAHPCRGGLTALHLAATAGHLEVVCVLLAAGIEPRKADASPGGSGGGMAPIPTADVFNRAARGEVKAIQALARGPPPAESPQLQACLDARCASGRTPLHVACGAGHAAVARALLLAGACWWAADRSGDMPLHVLVRGWQPDRAEQYCATALALLAR